MAMWLQLAVKQHVALALGSFRQNYPAYFYFHTYTQVQKERQAPKEINNFFFFAFFRATPMAYGASQARGRIGAAAPGLCHQSQQHGLWAVSATYTTAQGSTRSLTHWVSPGTEPTSMDTSRAHNPLWVYPDSSGPSLHLTVLNPNHMCKVISAI